MLFAVHAGPWAVGGRVVDLGDDEAYLHDADLFRVCGKGTKVILVADSNSLPIGVASPASIILWSSLLCLPYGRYGSLV
jgi:hypothetical protein